MSIALTKPKPAASTSVVRGMLFILFRANRYRVAGMLVFWSLMALVANTVLARALATFQSLPIACVAIMTVVMSVGLLVILIGSFSLNIDIERAFQGYPEYLLRLPASSVALALWPILIGTVTVSAAWLIIDKAIVVPIGVASMTPALGCLSLCAALVCSQAVSWSPLGNVARCVLYSVILGIVAWSAVNASVGNLSTAPCAIAYAALIVGGAATAVMCVSISRRGDIYLFERLRPLVERLKFPRPVMPAGVDGPRAFTWFDWATEGYSLPLCLIVIIVFTLPILAMTQTVQLVDALQAQSWPIAGIRMWAWSKVAIFICPAMSMMLLTAIGCNVNQSTFIMSRPISSLDIARTKLATSAGSILAMLAILAALVCIVLMTPATDGSVHGSFGVLLSRYANPEAAPALILAAAACVVAMLRARTDGIWAATLRSQWLVSGQMMIPLIVFCVVAVLNAFGVPAFQWFLKNFPTLIVVTAVVKVALMAFVVVDLLKRRLITMSLLSTALLALAAVAACLAFLTVGVLTSTPALVAACIGIVAVPIVRIGLIPLAVDRARHG